MNNIYSSRKRNLLVELGNRGIYDQSIISAIQEVPREEFVPENLKDYAYENIALSVGSGQTISAPYVIAYRLQEISLNRASRVLEIGTGTGYQTAILSLLCDKVYSIEIVPKLAISATNLLKKLGYYDNGNIEIEIGNGYNRKYDKNFFDAIIVNATPTTVQRHLIEILKINGSLVMKLRARLDQQKLFKIITRNDQPCVGDVLCDVRLYQ